MLQIYVYWVHIKLAIIEPNKDIIGIQWIISMFLYQYMLHNISRLNHNYILILSFYVFCSLKIMSFCGFYTREVRIWITEMIMILQLNIAKREEKNICLRKGVAFDIAVNFNIHTCHFVFLTMYKKVQFWHLVDMILIHFVY